jgi:hypothetical protein
LRRALLAKELKDALGWAAIHKKISNVLEILRKLAT